MNFRLAAGLIPILALMGCQSVDTNIPTLRTGGQMTAQLERYMAAPDHKAFYVSRSGNIARFGFTAEHPTIAEAIDVALVRCEQAGSTARDCKLYHVDDLKLEGERRDTAFLAVSMITGESVLPPPSEVSIPIDWEGVGDAIPTRVAVYGTPMFGRIDMAWPTASGRSRDVCGGRFSVLSEGDSSTTERGMQGIWQLDCSNGITARGEFKQKAAQTPFIGSGTDSEGRALSFWYLPPEN